MKRWIHLSVKDRWGDSWGFNFKGDPKWIPMWRDAGFEVYLIEATVPAWAASLGLAKPWAAAQQAWQWARFW